MKVQNSLHQELQNLYIIFAHKSYFLKCFAIYIIMKVYHADIFKVRIKIKDKNKKNF